MNVKLSVAIFREGERFVAYSPALDLSTSGETFEQVKHRFDEAAQLFFEEVTKKGMLETVLTELGWQKTVRDWQPPMLVAQEEHEVRIPG